MSDPNPPKLRRKVVSVRDGGQLDFFVKGRSTPGRRRRVGVVRFVDPDPTSLTIGAEPLDRYLQSRGLRAALVVREVMREMDWSEFESAYDLSGRRPYHPAVLLGLALYGIMQNETSLRSMEELAKKDVGAMWVTGGACPDHTTLGRCLQLHAERLTDKFFESLTIAVLKRLKSKPRVLAGDGTVIEAAGSRFRTLKLEAAQREAKKTKERAEAAPDDRALQQAAEKAQVVADAVEERAERRKQWGADAKKTRVCETDPEAPVLLGKRGEVLPAYTPSVVASPERVIVAQHVHPSSELESVRPLVEQFGRVCAVEPDEEPILLLDAGYDRGPIADLAVEKNVNLLCPSARKPRDPAGNQKFTKDDFRYLPRLDVFECPRGEHLTRSGRRTDKRRGLEYTAYLSSRTTCRICPLRGQCLPKKGPPRRIISRYDSDDARETLRKVMMHPQAQALLELRRVFVEPVFGELREIQGLRKFHRFGLKGAQLEFALHACAHNLRRLVALGRAAVAAQIARLILLSVTLLSRNPAGRTSRAALPPADSSTQRGRTWACGDSWAPCGQTALAG